MRGCSCKGFLMLVPLYFCISLLSAFLLFLVQPMAAKAVLPVLGGAPFVWNGCMLFFQTLLLGGYLYSHTAIKHLQPRQQVKMHLGVLLVALLLFPSSFSGSGLVDAAAHPLLWLMGTLMVSIAVPFFALSATAPMIQGWFSMAGHRRSANPYFLYAASNLGSFGSLLAYLIWVEPNFNRAEQLSLLHGGFAMLAALFAVAGVRLYRNHNVRAQAVDAGKGEKIPARRILYWLTLSFVPSSLLYGVTQYISTDVASMPLLWVFPLALYLLTFVLVFADRPIGLYTCRWLHIPVATTIIFIIVAWQEYDMWLMLMHMAAFFVVTMACHGYLSQSRPAASQLTSFYLWVSFGGVLGGVFNTFVAPNIFHEITEYPLMIFLSVLVCMPLGLLKHNMLRWKAYMPAVAAIAVSVGFYLLIVRADWLAVLLHQEKGDIHAGIWVVIYELWRMVVVVMLCFGAQRLKLVNTALFIALILGAELMLVPYNTNVYLFNERNIFGVNRVFYRSYNNANYFRHGTTDHGKQSLDEAFRLNPVSYYPPLEMLFTALDIDPRTHMKPIGLMGLGVGTIACYGQKGQVMDIFEIDPLVLKIATTESLFTYMRDCPPTKNVEIGDARIGISKKPDGYYSLIIADAFTSDAVPVHLMTQEAISMYLDKVTDGGAVAIHITNRHLKLAPVVSTIARELGAYAYYYEYDPKGDPLGDYAEWTVVTRNANILQRLRQIDSGWVRLKTYDPDYLWRDDFSNILHVIRLKTNFWGLF